MTHQKFTPQEISYSFRNIKNENGYQVIVKQKLKMSISENKKAKMELKTLCKFQNIGFCKFKETYYFRHVQNVCKNKTCSRQNCLARHPRICKCFLKNKRKFKEKCCFDHKHSEKDVKTHEMKENKEIIALKEDIRKLEEENEALETNINQKTKELEKAGEEVKELKEINDLLLNDVKQVNEKVM